MLAAAARLGYRPDRAASVLASRHSRLIGVVMDISNTFHAQLVEDVHEAAERHGYDLLLSTITRSRNETRAVETLLDSRCEALVLLGPELPAEHLTALGRQLPVVVVGRPVPPDGVDVVRAADDEGVGRAVDHLVGLGHRRIAYVDGGTGPIASCAAAATSAPCVATNSATRPGHSRRPDRGVRRPRGTHPAPRRAHAHGRNRVQRPLCHGAHRHPRPRRHRRPRQPCPSSATTTARSPGSRTST